MLREGTGIKVSRSMFALSEPRYIPCGDNEVGVEDCVRDEASKGFCCISQTGNSFIIWVTVDSS